MARIRRGTIPTDTFHIGVYFADSNVNMYQIRQWYGPLRLLSETWPVLIIARDPIAAATIQEESDLEVLWAPNVSHLERLVRAQPLRIVMYVNQNTRNFQMLRYGQRWHVFINHGESDKMYMTTNQFKAYDYAFIAGQAARDRLAANLWNYDVDERTFQIGRPQTDHAIGDPPYPADGRTVVLYAPTWEGDRPAAAYGSVVSHGEALAQAVLASPAHRFIYRPHPRTGVLSAEFRAAHERIVRAIELANRHDRDAHHMYDRRSEITWQLSHSDIAVCDISAMIYDRLATGKPLLVTQPVSQDAHVDRQGYLGVCQWLTADRAPDILDEVQRLTNDESARSTLEHWSTHYFGDVSPGAPTQRLHSAVEELMCRWDAEANSRL